MKNTFTSLFVFLLVLPLELFSQISVTIDASATPQPISKYIYGRNNSLSDDPKKPLTTLDWTRLHDAGVTMLRESGGNNCSKYNWRLKLSSHPDWYNNVYAHDWDFAASSLQQNIPGAQGMWAFQLLGKAAMTSSANFADFTFNQSKWWNGVNQNLAGGGKSNPSTWAAVTNPNTAPTKAAQEGNIDLYLQNWTADSTVLLLDHWFNKLGLDKNHIQYWNMDNEIEIWNGTHDDVMPTQLSPEDFMQRYFAVAKKARAAYPGIKLVGPVTANEWQWYNWNGNVINVNGTYYPWLEFFIKRVAEEEKASGIRLLDVLDIHFYPGSTKVDEVVQMHRVFFDKTYDFPEANGVKKISGTFDNTQTKEYILGRCSDWLTKYMGADHKVTFGLTETGVAITDPNALAVWYAGTIGEFMRHPEMEIFTPWSWSIGMWEVLHLYSRYNKPSYVPATSTNESLISAYPTVNATGDSLTVMVVNRSSTAAQSVKINIKGFSLANESFNVLKLSGLPSYETFFSHQSNALQAYTTTTVENSVTLSMPALSVMAIQFKGSASAVTAVDKEFNEQSIQVFPNPATDSKVNLIVNRSGKAAIDMIDQNGKIMKDIYHGEISSTPFKKDIDTSSLSKGIYFIRFQLDGKITARKILIY